ncbi:MAG: leucine-rich repeat protein [Solobacterium sp.]|nr:leucine-rich repeat protein [Solobacterium sp.]
MYRKIYTVLMSLFLTMTVLPQRVYAEEEPAEEAAPETEEGFSEVVIPETEEITEPETEEIIEDVPVIEEEQEISSDPEETAEETTEAEAAADVNGDYEYSVNAAGITITGYTGSGEEVVIPSEIDGMPVKGIGGSAFRGCSSVKRITIPEGVTNIGDYAFCECSSLEEITIPDTVTGIGSYVFGYCSSLTGITIPDSAAGIGTSAFYECSSLTDITIPDSVTDIGTDAFSGCSSLEDITLPAGITAVENSTFYGCTNLTAVTIPDTVKTIGDLAFFDCSSLENVTIPGHVKSIGINAFRNCTGLSRIVIPSGVTAMGEGAFSGCENLQSAGPAGSGADIEYGWTKSIPSYAFSGCSSLTDVILPAGITKIAGSAFKGCSGLNSIAIPDSVTSIGNDAFCSCTGLKSITIPSGAASLAENAIAGCNQLETIINNSEKPIILPECPNARVIRCKKISTVNANQFEGYADLEEIGMICSDTISAYAFLDCSSLKTVHIRNTVKSIETGAFRNCPGDMTIHFYGTAEEWGSVSIKKYNDCLNTAAIVYHVPVSSIAFEQKTVQIDAGSTKTTKPVILPEDAENKTVRWTSSNTDTAAVDSSGKVTAGETGIAVITAVTEDGGYTAKYTVKVTKPIKQDDIAPIADQTYTGSAVKPSVTVTADGKTLVKDTDYTVSYKNNTDVGTAEVTVTGKGFCSGKQSVTFKILPAGTAKAAAANKAGGIRIAWKKVPGADGYYIYRSGTLVKTVKSGSTLSWGDTAATANGTKYTYKIVAYASVGKSIVSRSVTVYRLSRPAVSSLTNTGEGKMTVKWGKNTKGTGYQVQYSRSSDFTSSDTKTVAVTSNTTVAKAIGSLAKGVKYYVRIRTYKTVNSKKFYSMWSASKSIVTSGWKKVSGKWYYYKTNGVKATGWLKLSGKWYYFQSSGVMKTGWLKLSGKWYYFESSGAMVTGTRTIGSKTYEFDSSGVCLNP